MNDFERTKVAIVERVDLLNLVSEHVQMKRTGSRWVGLCPFHHEKTPSFGISPEKGLFKCFGCGAGGDLFKFVQLKENVSFMEAMQMLADRAGVDMPQMRRQSTGGVSRNDIAKVNEWAAGYFVRQLQDDQIGTATRDYVTQRGFSRETAAAFEVGLAPNAGSAFAEAARRSGFGIEVMVEADLLRREEGGSRTFDTFSDRLMFPIRDVTKRVIGFGGRTLIDHKAKYLNSRQNLLFDKGRNLYGIHAARNAMSEAGFAILVEGYTDCIALHQAGFAQTVATCGTALTESQVDLIRRYCDEVVLLFDSDQAGEKAADRAIELALPRYLNVKLARVPDGKDPSEFLRAHDVSAFSDVLAQAKDALEFKWRQTQIGLQAEGSDAERGEAVRKFVDLIARTSVTGAMDEIRRGLLLNQIGKLLNLEANEVHRLLARAERRLRASREFRPAGQSSHEAAQPADTPSVTGCAAPARPGHAVWTVILEVLLCEPGFVPLVREQAADIAGASPQQQRIVAAMYDLEAQFGEFQLSEVLGRCNDPQDSALVEALARRGSEAGGFEARLNAALSRLDTLRTDQALDSALSRGSLEEFQDKMKSQRHFAPRRARRRNRDAIDLEDQNSSTLLG